MVRRYIAPASNWQRNMPRLILVFVILALLVLALIIALLFATNVAHADPRWVTPPKRYVHQFPGTVTVYAHRFPMEWWKCGGLVYGCAFLLPGQCIIHVWKPKYNLSLYQHELAHCNGWGYWHPLP